MGDVGAGAASRRAVVFKFCGSDSMTPLTEEECRSVALRLTAFSTLTTFART